MTAPAAVVPAKRSSSHPQPGGARVRRIRFVLVAGIAASALAIFALTAIATAADSGALWRVVQACVANFELTGFAFPCLDVDLTGGETRGHVILRRPFGAPDTILAPTRRVVGVEDPWLQTSAAPNYFEAAWNARALAEGADEHPGGLEQAALAVNSSVSRSQDQLHIHMGCLASPARRRLQLLAPNLKIGEWTRVEGVLPGPEIRALRTGQARLEQIEPFRLAAEGFAATTQDRARLTIVVVQTRIAERSEFLILAWRVSAAAETAEQVAVPCSDRANAAGPR